VSRMFQMKQKIAIIGSGNWGSTVAKIIGHNVKKYPNIFHEEVRMWMFDEIFEGKKLSETFNAEHENKKYLPGIKIPPNVVAIPNLDQAASNCNTLVFVLPHQFLKKTCDSLKQVIPSGSRGISLIKGMQISGSGPQLISESIKNALNIDVCVLMGANIAKEVAAEKFSEATIGYRLKENGELFKLLFNTSYFRVSIIDDIPGVELCGALKNIVALGAGFIDGLGLPCNTKVAVMRIGLNEMLKFSKHFFPEVKSRTFFESCGIADLVVSCMEGRNRRCGEAFAKTGKSFEALEEEMLRGQKLQGTLTVEEVHRILKANNLTQEFPLFNIIYCISFEGAPVESIVDCMSTESKL